MRDSFDATKNTAVNDVAKIDVRERCGEHNATYQYFSIAMGSFKPQPRLCRTCEEALSEWDFVRRQLALARWRGEIQADTNAEFESTFATLIRDAPAAALQFAVYLGADIDYARQRRTLPDDDADEDDDWR
jgi:hypothetical protein